MREYLNYIKCSLCKSELNYQPLRIHSNEVSLGNLDGYLTCACSMIFPVVSNVPRLLPESFLDYEVMLKKALPRYGNLKLAILEKYKPVIEASSKQNESIKKTFGFEWSLLKTNTQVNIWDLDDQGFEDQLWNELKAEEINFENSVAIDVGCGHGKSGTILAKKCSLVFCMDVGLSVEQAALKNKQPNCVFIQAGINHLPFTNETFDLVYSSGVLHHNPDTKTAFDKVSALVKKNATLCIWLYQPFNNPIHKMMLGLRRVTPKLPVKVQFWLYFIFLLPLHKIIGLLKGSGKSWREIMINQLDMLSPRYRHEHTTQEVEGWLKEKKYTNIQVTTTNNYGFSIKGISGK